MAKVELTESEKRVLRQIRKFAGTEYKTYEFWFVYDDDGNAISWEGGWELPLTNQFRNQYSIAPNQQIRKNWE